MTETSGHEEAERLPAPSDLAEAGPAPAARSLSEVPEQRAAAHFVVGVHGDDSSEAALQWAARSAWARGADIEALMAWELPELPRHMPAGAHEAAEGVLADLRWALEAIVERSGIAAVPGVKVSTTLVAAPAKVALSEAVSRADLLVLGAAHHSAALAALSVARQVAAKAECPVVLVPPLTSAVWEEGGNRFVVGMDGSPQSLAALRWACDEADRRALPVHVFSISAPAETRQLVAAAVASEMQDHPLVKVELRESTGDAGEILAAESRGAEALVLGQHGVGAIARRLPSLGSVSRWCVAHPMAPIVVVPWRKARAV